MIDLSKAWAIARFEFLSVVKRWSYILSTFGLPLVIVGVSAAAVLVQSHVITENARQKKTFGIVDHSNVLAELDIWANAKKDSKLASLVDLDSVSIARFDNEDSAFAAMGRGEIAGAYLIKKDYLDTGVVHAYAPAGGSLVDVQRSTIQPVLAHALRRSLIAGKGDAAWAERVVKPVAFEHAEVSKQGEVRKTGDPTTEFLGKTTVPVLLGVLLLTALLSSSGYLVQTISQDKETKIVEVLLSSARSDEILTGKLVGLGAAGMLQFLVWSVMIIVVALAIAVGASAHVAWNAIAISPVYFALGYLFIGSLMLATASLGSNAAESQKLTLGWAALALIPLMVLLVLLDAPHGGLARALSFIPFTSPLTMVLRLAVDSAGVAAWEVALSLFVLVVGIWVAVRVGARLFRVGLLLSGTRPSFAELWRQARLLK